jgi:hypothetical protein
MTTFRAISLIASNLAIVLAPTQWSAAQDAVRHLPQRAATGLYDDPAAHIWGPNSSITAADGPHECTHEVQSELRQVWMKAYGGQWNAVYVLRDKAFMIREPPVTLRQVAAAVPQAERGKVYDLYLVRQAAAWSESLYLLDEWAAYLNGLECDLATDHPHNSIPWQAECCREFARYADTLVRVVRAQAPQYDTTQLAAVIAYQSRRTAELSAREPKP